MESEEEYERKKRSVEEYLGQRKIAADLEKEAHRQKLGIPSENNFIVGVATETNSVDHPSHYGGKDNPYEAIKVIEAWGLGFNLGNTIKYISRLGKKDQRIIDLKKARWYLDREIQNEEAKNGK